MKKIITLILLAAFLLLAPGASASVQSDVQKTLRVAQDQREAVTIALNTKEGLLGSIKNEARCSVDILAQSPGWDGQGNSDAEIAQTERATAFMAHALLGKAVLETKSSARWAQAVFRGTARWIETPSLARALRAQASWLDNLIGFGGKATSPCAVLQKWQEKDYRGIFQVLDQEIGKGVFQKTYSRSRKTAAAADKGVVVIAQKAGQGPSYDFFMGPYKRARKLISTQLFHS